MRTRAAMKLLLLDRDGVINQDSDDYIRSPEQWLPLPGAISALARLSRAGWTLAIATNQSGIARGYYDSACMEAIHTRLRALVAAEGGQLGLILHCPHGPDAGCDCRKPKPGMLLAIARHYHVDPSTLCFVGDSASDLGAAVAAGCQPVLVKTGKGLRTLQQGELPPATRIFADLSDVARYLITEQSGKPLTSCKK